jgi:hypothetical protein
MAQRGPDYGLLSGGASGGSISERSEKGHRASLASRRMRTQGTKKERPPKHQGKGKMGSVVRHVNEHDHKATTSHGGRAFSFGKWPG